MQEECYLTLQNFEGPLISLFHLVQKSEIDLKDISLNQIVGQYVLYLNASKNIDIDHASKFLDITSTLMWLKSCHLLPTSPSEINEHEIFSDSPLKLIPQLLDFYHLKEVATNLHDLQREQEERYLRGLSPKEKILPQPAHYLDAITLESLFSIFQEVLRKQKTVEITLFKEKLHLPKKIEEIKNLLIQKKQLDVSILLTCEMEKDEIIVVFLSLLQLLKEGIIELSLTPSQQLKAIILS